MKTFALLIAFLATPCAIAATAGKMTMWGAEANVIVGSTCEYAGTAQGGLQSPAATSPYITSQRACAVKSDLYQDGLACGRCYKVTFDNADNTEQTGCGVAGSSIIQVVGTGHDIKEFDCQQTAYQEITGCTTGEVGITYEEVECEGMGPGTATIIAQNAADAHVVFSNLPRPVASASLTVGGGQENTFVMSLVQGAWDVHTPHVTDVPVTFELTLDNGDLVELTECFSDWPQPMGASCSVDTTIGTSDSPTTTTSGSITTTPAPVTTTPSGCAGAWQQCAGNNFADTCCEEGTQCVQESAWYSQCRPSLDNNPTPATTPAPVTTTPPSCAAVWQQCAGNNFADTCCEEGSQCVFSNEWYSQCKPVRRNLRGLLRGQ